MIYFQKVANNYTIKILSQKAIEIFKEHYTDILGPEQVDYMIVKFHTPSAIKRQMRDGSNYYLVFDGANTVGFFALEKHGDRTFLSKFYLEKGGRKKGVGKEMLDKVMTLSGSTRAVYLTVNKKNDDALYFYLHSGFVEIGALKTDIGSGYYMDDYVLERPVVIDKQENKKVKGENENGSQEGRKESRRKEGSKESDTKKRRKESGAKKRREKSDTEEGSSSKAK